MTVKESITVQDACDLLNEFLRLDPECANELIKQRENCCKSVERHPTIQVDHHEPHIVSKVGFLGLLNGMFGVRDDGMGPICYEEKKGKIIKFKPTPSKRKKKN